MSENTLVNAVYEKIFADNIPDKLAEGDVLTLDEIEVCMDKITEFAIEVIDHMIEVNQNNYACWLDEMRRPVVKKLKRTSEAKPLACVPATTLVDIQGDAPADAPSAEINQSNDVPVVEPVDNVPVDDNQTQKIGAISLRDKYYTKHREAYFRWASQPNIALFRLTVPIEEYYAAHGLLDELKSCEPINKSTIISIVAAQNGHPEIIHWLTEKYPIDAVKVCSEASKNGHLNVLKYIEECWENDYVQTLWDDAAIDAAAAGHLHIVQWLLLRGCDVRTIREAAEYQPAVLDWINSMYA